MSSIIHEGGIPNLYDALSKLLKQIPQGCVTTYGDLADALGSIKAARWVGEFLLNHDHAAVNSHAGRLCCFELSRFAGEFLTCHVVVLE